MKSFDRKFGENLLTQTPPIPAVYLFRDASEVIYVGKAKNVRRRLSNYRNASRRKAHKKMRTIVREATSLQILPQADETMALLVENKLIQELRPRFNIDGAFSFLYPAIGIRNDDEILTLCLTTDVGTWTKHSFDWYGVFRSRTRVKAAFSALHSLLELAAHPVSPTEYKKKKYPRARGGRVIAFRRGNALKRPLREFLAGKSINALGQMASILLDKRRARLEASDVQKNLHFLKLFFEQDLVPLRNALSGSNRTYVPQQERDPLFIAQSAAS